MEKGQGSSFVQTWIPFTQGYFVSSLIEIGPVVMEKKMKMWKVYANNDDDDGSSLDTVISAQVGLKQNSHGP